MKARVSTLIGGIALIATLTSMAAPPAPEDGKALLLGTDTSKARVLFRKLDDGPLLWIAPMTLGTKLSLDPGHHTLNVMCQFNSYGMSRLVPGTIAIDVEAGHVYDVTGTLASGELKCDVAVSKHS
jgi:hypothetical protein